MKESLDSVKNVYHLLILVSTVCVIFGYGQKFIPNPYEFALMRIDNIERRLADLQRNGKIALEYNRHFFVADSSLIFKMKSSIANLDTVRSIYQKRYLKGARQDSLEKFLKNYERYSIETQKFLSRPYISDSVDLGGLNYYSKHIFNDDLFGVIFEEHESFENIYTKNIDVKVPIFKNFLIQKSESMESTMERNVDIFGLKIGINDSVVLIPILPFGLMLYLHLLVRHININIRIKEDADTIKVYPCVLFFKDQFSQCVVVITLFIPVLGAVYVVGKYQTTNMLKDILFFMYPIIFSVQILTMRRVIERIIKRVHQNT